MNAPTSVCVALAYCCYEGRHILCGLFVRLAHTGFQSMVYRTRHLHSDVGCACHLLFEWVFRVAITNVGNTGVEGRDGVGHLGSAHAPGSVEQQEHACREPTKIMCGKKLC